MNKWVAADDIFDGDHLIGTVWKSYQGSILWGYSLDQGGLAEEIVVGFLTRDAAEDEARRVSRENRAEAAVSVDG